MKRYRGKWLHRRQAIYGTLLYCAAMLVWLVIKGTDGNELHASTAGSLLLLMACTLGSFIFGRVVDGDDPEDDDVVGEDTSLGTWKERRRVMFVSLLACAAGISYLILKGADTEINRTISDGLVLLAGSVLVSFIFGLAWDNSRLQQRLGNRAGNLGGYVPPYSPPLNEEEDPNRFSK